MDREFNRVQDSLAGRRILDVDFPDIGFAALISHGELTLLPIQPETQKPVMRVLVMKLVQNGYRRVRRLYSTLLDVSWFPTDDDMFGGLGRKS